MGKSFLAVCTVAIWLIWKWRNSILFAEGEEIAKKKKEDIFPAIQTLSTYGLAIGFIILRLTGIIGVLLLSLGSFGFV